jgi:hypothetical protein
MSGGGRHGWCVAALLGLFLASGMLWTLLPGVPGWSGFALPVTHTLIRLAVVAVFLGWH